MSQSFLFSILGRIPWLSLLRTSENTSLAFRMNLARKPCDISRFFNLPPSLIAYIHVVPMMFLLETDSLSKFSATSCSLRLCRTLSMTRFHSRVNVDHIDSSWLSGNSIIRGGVCSSLELHTWPLMSEVGPLEAMVIL